MGAGSDQRRPVVNQDFYVTGRYYCVSVDKEKDSRGSCDLVSHATSCAEALKAQQQTVAERGDVCQKCTENTTDHTKKYAQKMEWIHLGPCKGFPS
jgi:hypothetical protein